MLVKHLYGPKVGQQLRPDLPPGVEDLDPKVAVALIGGGFAEEIKYKNYHERLASLAKMQPAQAPAVVRWNVGKDEISGRFGVVAKCSRSNCTVYRFNGSPDKCASLKFLHSCSAVAPEAIPQNVVDDYRKLFKPRTVYTTQEAVVAKLGAPSHDKPYLTGEEMAEANLKRGATSESSLARQGGFSPDRPYLTQEELQKQFSGKK